MAKDLSKYRGMYEKGQRKVDLDTPTPWFVGRPSPERATQFMPFAALKGYDALIDDIDHYAEPRKMLTAEDAAMMDREIAETARGDEVSITTYVEGWGPREISGRVTDLGLELGWIEVDHERIRLYDIDSFVRIEPQDE